MICVAKCNQQKISQLTHLYCAYQQCKQINTVLIIANNEATLVVK